MLALSYISGRSSVKIAASIEQGLSSGRAASGDRLPPVRTLAAALGVSPATVAAAYRLLRDRGLVVTDGRRGTRIRASGPILAPSAGWPAAGDARDLSTGNPDPRLLPRIQTRNASQRLYGEELNDGRLLEVARAQFQADAVPSAHVAVTSGALDGIERVLREHLRPGDRVVVEDPCFTGIADLLASLGLTPVAVPVDDEGLRCAELERVLRRPAAALIVTPRAQNPTGAAFSAKRARQIGLLLHRYPDLLLIEDDHAGAVAGAGYHTLIRDGRARWAVVRSVSKSLGPDLRVALLAADPMTVARLEGRQTLGIRWVSHILQRTVASLLTHARTPAMLGRAASTYAARRGALLESLSRHGIEAHGVSGLNIWIPVPDESSLIRGLLARGWAVQAGERYRLATPPAIRVTVASLSPADSQRFAADLNALLSSRSSAV